MVDFQVRVMETNRSKYSGFGKEEGGDKKKKKQQFVWLWLLCILSFNLAPEDLRVNYKFLGIVLGAS